MQKKETLRAWAKEQRKNKKFIPIQKKLIGKLMNTEIYQKSTNIMIFYPLKYEINLLSLLEDKTKNFIFPAIQNNEIVPYKNNDNFSIGKYNIKEPINSTVQKLSEIDLVIIPALCVDIKGFRIGYGKGYYDKFITKLEKTRTSLISIIYDDFIVENINPSPIDQKIDMVITEKRTIKF